MPLISPPRCPVCRAAVDAGDLRRERRRHQNVFLSRIRWGIRCPACRTTLKIQWWPTYLISLSFIALAIGSFSFASPTVLHSEGTVALFMIIWFGGWAASAWWAPLFARLERPGPHEEIAVEKSQAEKNADDPEYQAQLQELDELNEWIDKTHTTPRRSWRCKGCGEENPGNFEVCWKCQKEE